MRIHFDLHSHSIFAGGAGSWKRDDPTIVKKMQKRFFETALYSPLKGTNLLGTGDCQFDIWFNFLKCHFEEESDGVFQFKDSIPAKYKIQDLETTQPNYILQTEVIFTGPTPNSHRKKKAHVIIFFPDFETVSEFRVLLDRLNVAHENMARPFIVSDNVEEVSQKLHQILDLNEMVEAVPAHVLTPEGVYGSNDRINSLAEFFGTASERIHAIETGLSADPTILELIPELDRKALISNADAHSSALNRVGREFTSVDLPNLSYSNLIRSIRNNSVVQTAEFHPAEGRYFLTGHREGRSKPAVHNKGEFCYFSPQNVPDNDICPICQKELTVGVFQRATEISKYQTGDEARQWQSESKRKFVTMVPLVEILAKSMNIKSVSSKTVFKQYVEIMKQVGTEINLWTDKAINLDSNISNKIVENIEHVKNGNFYFSPLGYDGLYGDLIIGETIDFRDIDVVNS